MSHFDAGDNMLPESDNHKIGKLKFNLSPNKADYYGAESLACHDCGHVDGDHSYHSHYYSCSRCECYVRDDIAEFSERPKL
jgi:hypothetical protein